MVAWGYALVLPAGLFWPRRGASAVVQGTQDCASWNFCFCDQRLAARCRNRSHVKMLVCLKEFDIVRLDNPNDVSLNLGPGKFSNTTH